MCKYQTDICITKIDFSHKGLMEIHFKGFNTISLPVSLFPEIKKLSLSERKKWMVFDGQFFSFEDLSTVYSIKDLLSAYEHVLAAKQKEVTSVISTLQV